VAKKTKAKQNFQNLKDMVKEIKLANQKKNEQKNG